MYEGKGRSEHALQLKQVKNKEGGISDNTLGLYMHLYMYVCVWYNLQGVFKTLSKPSYQIQELNS